MNQMLKIAYDMGCRQAVHDMEKVASPYVDKVLADGARKIPSALFEAFARNPATYAGAGLGGLTGGVAGYANSEDGMGLRGALTGALGGAALGGAAGLGLGGLRNRMLDTDTLGLAYRVVPDSIIRDAYPSEAQQLLLPFVMEGMKQQPALSVARALGAPLATGAAGGLGAAYLAGANEEPWYDRINPFA